MRAAAARDYLDHVRETHTGQLALRECCADTRRDTIRALSDEEAVALAERVARAVLRHVEGGAR